MESLGYFVVLGVSFRSFSNRKLQLSLHKRLVDLQILTLIIVFNIPIYDLCQKSDQNCKITLKKEVLDFWLFSVSISDIFHSKNSKKTFSDNPTRQQTFFLINPFQLSNPRSLSKIWKKMQKNPLKVWKFWIRCLFRCQFERIFIGQSAITSS